MEHLKYIVDDKTIAEVLGIENFTTANSAMLEIIKNAYDAQASKINIEFRKESILIVDDGKGMDRDTILNHWMYVGKSDKGYSIINKETNEERILAGSKGIGRFALARLGGSVTINSLKDKFKGIKWKTDWNVSTIEESTDINKIGTKIEIKELRDNWTDLKITELVDFLSKTCNDERMQITINYKSINHKVEFIFRNPKIGINYTSKINLKYDSKEQTLNYLITNDEFDEKIKDICTKTNVNQNVGKIQVINELISEKDIDFDKITLEKMLKNLGDFSGELYFSLKSSTKKDKEKFFYKHSNLENRYDCGIILYRNAFSISSYDGSVDWMDLNSRMRLSPAAATHKTGSWRVRSNQLSGWIKIDKNNNSSLRDLSNRQGLEQNDYFKIFKKIILISISNFERYRQSIIRELDKEDVNKYKKTQTPIIDKLINSLNKNIKLSDKEIHQLINELITFKNQINTYVAEKNITEERYKYDVRILNILATLGLKASSVAHEMKNDRNNISVNVKYIREALKAFGLWDEISSEENTKFGFRNIPLLLDQNEQINKKIKIFISTLLSEQEKCNFIAKKHNIYAIIDEMRHTWEKDYSILKIDLRIKNNIEFFCGKDIFYTIFDNLILNTCQQNSSKQSIKITISINLSNNILNISYHDNGVGLDKKYIDNPFRILEVHETSRKNGHGLGMWIVNNTIQMTGGQIKDIIGENGFTLKFTIGGK